MFLVTTCPAGQDWHIDCPHLFADSMPNSSDSDSDSADDGGAPNDGNPGVAVLTPCHALNVFFPLVDLSPGSAGRNCLRPRLNLLLVVVTCNVVGDRTRVHSIPSREPQACYRRRRVRWRSNVTPGASSLQCRSRLYLTDKYKCSKR